MKIIYLKTIGFRKFEHEFETELFDITTIKGANTTGKTNILYAIVWGFLGTNLTGDDKVYLGNKNSNDCYVEIHFIDNLGKKHILKRLKNKFSNKQNFLLLDEQPISQEDLSQFYSDKKLFLSIINSNYFITKKPAEQKELLDKYLPEVDIKLSYDNLEDNEKSLLEGCPTNVFELIQDLNNNKSICESNIKKLQGKIDYAENLVNVEVADVKKFEKTEELTLARQELAFLESDETLKNKEEQQKLVDSINEQIENLEKQIEDLSIKMKDGKAKYLNIKNEKTSYCPTCHQVLEEKSKVVTIQNMKSDLEDAYDTKLQLELKLQNLKSKMVVEKCMLYATTGSNAIDKQAEIAKVKNQIQLLEQEQLEIEKYNNTISIQKENIEKSKQDIIKFKQEIDTLRNNIENIKQSKNVAQKLLVNHIEKKMEFATKHLKDVKIKYYSIIKETGEIKQDFIITYKGNELKNLSRSETITTSLEISNMLNKISGINVPLFIDDSESCADYNFIEDFSNDTQILISKVEKGQKLTIKNYKEIETMPIAA